MFYLLRCFEDFNEKLWSFFRAGFCICGCFGAIFRGFISWFLTAWLFGRGGIWIGWWRRRGGVFIGMRSCLWGVWEDILWDWLFVTVLDGFRVRVFGVFIGAFGVVLVVVVYFIFIIFTTIFSYFLIWWHLLLYYFEYYYLELHCYFINLYS
jgi:hypothetical protein